MKCLAIALCVTLYGFNVFAAVPPSHFEKMVLNQKVALRHTNLFKTKLTLNDSSPPPIAGYYSHKYKRDSEFVCVELFNENMGEQEEDDSDNCNIGENGTGVVTARAIYNCNYGLSGPSRFYKKVMVLFESQGENCSLSFTNYQVYTERRVSLYTLFSKKGEVIGRVTNTFLIPGHTFNNARTIITGGFYLEAI